MAHVVSDTFWRSFDLPPGKKSGKNDHSDKRSLIIHQQCVGDVGCVVWDAAISLSQLLAYSDVFTSVDWTRKRVIELGAGTGLVGLVASALGADVIITDLPECIELMQRNCEVNAGVLSGRCQAKSLVWGEDVSPFTSQPFDLILMADLIYYEGSLEPLVSTLRQLCAGDTNVLMSYEQRTTGKKVELTKQFFQMIEADFFVEELSAELLPEQYRCADIHIIAMARKLLERD